MGFACAASAVWAGSPSSGRALVGAAVDAPATLVGTVREGQALDARAWFAWVEVERSLSGPHVAGERVAIAWDERVVGGVRRFEDGARVLVALEPLPGWSIWRERLGERQARGVAKRGEAWLRDPDARTLQLMAAWLARPAAERSTITALPDLAALVAETAPSVARGALDQIERLAGVAVALSAPEADAARSSLRGAIVDPERPEALRRAILSLIGRRQLPGFESELRALAEPGSPFAAAAITTLAALPSGVSEGDAAAWLTRPEADVRTAVLRAAGAGLEDAVLEDRLDHDVDPGVRAAAVHALVERHGFDVFARIEPLLSDPNAPEGAAAVRALGGLGEPVVAPLVEKIRASGLDGARGPLLVLTLAGGSGPGALREVAAGHEDAAVRGFASFLLGRPPPDH